MRSHAKSKTHVGAHQVLRRTAQPNLLQIFSQEKEKSVASATVASASSVNAPTIAGHFSAAKVEAKDRTVIHTANECQTSVFVHSQHMRNLTTKGEIKYCLKIDNDHSLIRSANHSGDIFQEMFPDSEIAKNLKMSKDKTGYFITFGLGEHYRKKAIDTADSTSLLVVQFDESLNKVSQKCQMDLHIRYMDNNNSCMVATKYRSSASLGHENAENLLTALKKCLPNCVTFNKVIQLGMDGPSVNKKLFNFVQDEMSETPYNLLNIGSCGIHTVHNTFKTVFKKCPCDVQKFLRAY